MMTPATRLSRTLAAAVLLVAVFATLSGLSMPVADRAPSPLRVGVTLALMIAHALLYWFSSSLRLRFSARTYAAMQYLAVFAIGFSTELVPTGLALYIALTVDTIVSREPLIPALAVTGIAIALFVVNAAVQQDLYRATTAGLILAITGLFAHLIAMLWKRQAFVNVPTNADHSEAIPRQPATSGRTSYPALTVREQEVLRALARGARSAEIAETLNISERTVKSHLANIYQKLGVESRTAAVAAAHQRGWL